MEKAYSPYQQEKSYKDIPTILLENRIISINGEINENTAYAVTSALMILNEESTEKPIQMFICSGGGSCVHGLAIIDMMNYIKAPVYTYCMGIAASMGAAILSAGEKGHRGIMENAYVMCHQALISMPNYNNIQDANITLKHSTELNDRLCKIIAKNCNKSLDNYLKSVDRDYYMTAEEALKFGIVDEIVKGEKTQK